MKSRHEGVANRNKLKNRSLLFFGVASLLWFIFRTGAKPSRIVYPCQRAALANSSMLLGATISLSVAMGLTKTQKFLSKKGTTVALLIIVAIALINGRQFWGGLQSAVAVNPNQEIQLTLEPRNATAFPASNIYVVNGRAQAHIDELINLMGSHGLVFYKSVTSGPNRGPDGLIAHNDVVLIKINEEWDQRGGTNTDVLKELIQATVNHPDGFTGEIVVADNGQWGGSMDWTYSNAEDIYQSTQDVVNMFSSTYHVSAYTWRYIRGTHVNEYSTGDMNDGYILNDTADPTTGIYVSYPKFRTVYGTYVSFKYGVWNGASYENRLKVINVPVLKSHRFYGVTGAVKHYMGVQSEGSYASGGLANGHPALQWGGMGTLMVQSRMPTLNIIDAIWVNANPGDQAGPSTPYGQATKVNVLMASTDPVALDYWAGKHALVQAAHIIGYTDAHTLDPDSTDRTGVYTEAFGIWLTRTRDAMVEAGYSVTTSENRMNVYVTGQNTYDIAVTNVTTDKTIVILGQTVHINVTIQNRGNYQENFAVTVYANTTSIASQSITLLSNGSTTITLNWNTVGFVKGNYVVSAYATPVPGETNTADNTKTANNLVTVLSEEHDVAISGLPSKTVVGQGYTSIIKLTAMNVGSYPETFKVTLYVNSTSLPSQIVTLVSGASKNVTFTWNTTGFVKGNYTISAHATPVPGETDAADNTYMDGNVIVAMIGDITGPTPDIPDGKVDIRDTALVAKYFGQSVPPAPPNYDITGSTPGIPDNNVDVKDIATVAKLFG